MNKKFSTLVAGLLFASAFSAYAGTAASMMTAPTEIETRGLIPGKDAVIGNATGLATVKTTVTKALNGFTNNARLQVFQAANGAASGAAEKWLISSAGVAGAEADYTAATTAADKLAFYFTLDGDKLVGGNGTILSLDGVQHFEIVPLKSDAATATSFFALKAISSDGAKNGKYITLAAGIDAAGTLAANGTVAVDAAIFASIETAFAATGTTGANLNAQLKDGFNLSVAFGTATLTGSELFAGKLTAMAFTTDLIPAIPQTSVLLKNKDGKYLVFDASLNPTNAVKGGFKLISEKDAKLLAAGASAGTAMFEIKVADNASGAVQVTVDGNKRLYANVSNGTNVLTALDPASLGTNVANWATTSLGVNNTVDFKKFLTGKYVKVSFVKRAPDAPGATDAQIAANAAAVAYKVNGLLGLRYNATANAVQSDYIKSTSVVAEDPATMWAPSIVSNNLVLTNRENKNVKVTISSLRNEATAGVYLIDRIGATADGLADDEQIKIEFVNSVTKTDGYMVQTENVLRNTTYYLGQSRRNADGDVPAYWAENHGTHQIGATVKKDDEATKWNVELIKKVDPDYKSQIDSVLVVSSLYTYNTTTGVITATPDTLAVLPYVFQNRSNREYVNINDETNLEYYICDKDNKETPRSAQKFALKKKPGVDIYNYVNLETPTGYNKGNALPMDAVVGQYKVYLKNSESKGAWENIAAYADDANSLMVVEKVEAPEYRKVVKEWGDIVKIYREEYPTEVLFEKRDIKSVVDNVVGKDTLSFLNVNNSVSTANPALFVDTAYVNRKIGEVDNTCYQYLLAVRHDKEDKVVCPYNPEHNSDEWRAENGGPCADAKEDPSIVRGHFLINLIDTAYAYKEDHLHNNPYINMVEADENLAKLSFVPGYHTKDTLYLTRKGGETVKLGMNNPNFNVAKFAFRYVDDVAGSFKIQTQYKDYKAVNQKKFNESASNEGYLRWVNGTVVVTNKYLNGETFNMEEDFTGKAVSNEAIETSSISVVATNGAVIIKGAQGKKVTISNVLGQTVASTVITSNEDTISAPVGVVIVAVEGEAAVKAIVK